MEHAEGTFPGDGGTPLYYQCWHPQTAARAVLAVVHGFFEHSGRYESLADWFVPRGYAVFALDQRGHGRSPGKRGQTESLDQLHGDVRGFLALVHGKAPNVPLFLFGHSQGGLLVLNYLLHDPSEVRGVVTSSPCLRQRLMPQALVPAIKVLSRVAPWLSVGYRLEATDLTHDPAVIESYKSDPLVHGRAGPRTAALFFAAGDWTMAHAHELQVPCLILHGTDDTLCAPEAAAAFYERVRLTDKERIEYKGFYHEVLNEIGRERALADMEAWLDRHL